MSQSVAIITSTIGRAELEKAILSVKSQTYPHCKHYIFVDGLQYADKAKQIVDKYPDLIVTYLPMNTGANRWVNSSINAIAPFLVKEDIICYLDDDNWYENNHIEQIVAHFEAFPKTDFVYSLRNFIDDNDNFICQDHFESLGFWQHKLPDKISINVTYKNMQFNFNLNQQKRYHIDTNCYAFRRTLAITLAQSWYTGVLNDRHVLQKLMTLHSAGEIEGRCTGHFTVNYRLDLLRYFSINEAFYAQNHISADEAKEILRQLIIELNQMNIKAYDHSLPWYPYL